MDIGTCDIIEESVIVKGQPKHLVLFLHGYEDSAFSLEKRLSSFFNKLDNIAFHLPQAPFKCEINKNKRQWFSILQFDPENKRRDTSSIEESLQIYEQMKSGIIEAASYLQRYIENCILQYDLSYKDIFLAGFSQGATMAMYLSLMMEEKIGGCIDFNGALSPYSYLKKAHKSAPDCLLIHGDADSIVRFPLLEANRQELTNIGCHVETKQINNGSHKVTEEGLSVAVDFIKSRI